MKKRIISAILSMATVISTVTALTSNALAIDPMIGNSEEYQERIKDYENYYLLTEKETEYFDNIISENNVTKVWLHNKQTNDSFPYAQFDDYTFEVALDDIVTLTFELPTEDSELIGSELADVLGYKSYYSIECYNTADSAKVGIIFNSDNHKINYMIAEKAFSTAREKYPLKKKSVRINAVKHIYHVSLQSCLTTVYGDIINGVQLYKMTEQEFKEFYDSINHDYIKENFRAVYNPETRKIEFPDDYTQEEKLGCFSYFAEKYDAKIHEYRQTSALEPISVEFSDEISYVDGDANHDKVMTIADAAAIFQSLANPDKYKLSAQGEFNADSKGDGITVDDAVRIQKKLAGITE